ncbi:MAG: ATP-dependent Clp protease adapter ClpS [Rickettsiales bacterium]|nr:ATP-dependent Clp protease adapter ClpS [Rickettsiales bacterium]
MGKHNKPEGDSSVLTRDRTRVRTPRMYKVVLHNDDYSPMEFVVAVLQQIFHLSVEDATRIMLEVHNRGIGVAGLYTYEAAETKVQQVLSTAQAHEHPLQCSMEPE